MESTSMGNLLSHQIRTFLLCWRVGLFNFALTFCGVRCPRDIIHSGYQEYLRSNCLTNNLTVEIKVASKRILL